jgi:hypothetical protein
MCLNACRAMGQAIRQIRQSAKAVRGKRTVAVHFTVTLVLALNGSITGNLSLPPTSYYTSSNIRAARREFFMS